MCGIVGYVGNDQATPFLINGLKLLEYRGYDSAGVAICNKNDIMIKKSVGKIKNLEDKLLNLENFSGTLGIGHTRWATHGKPSEINSHPHISTGKKFAVVHNGIIENYLELKDVLSNQNKQFISETDTEVISQLLEFNYDGDFLRTVNKTVNELNGSFALGIVCSDHPDTLIAAKKDSPLIIGIGENENYIASDIPALLPKTRYVYRLKDGEIALLKKDAVEIYRDGKRVEFEPTYIEWDIQAAEKNGFEHFMLKEIMEQPRAVRDTINSYVHDNDISFESFNLSEEELKEINNIYIIACGSAYHVGCVAKYVLEKIVKKQVCVELASEFRYKDVIADDKTLVIAISQSGETADTLAAIKKAKGMNTKVLSIVNVRGSSIANESDNVIYTLAGPEIAVATTKAYSTQLAVVYMLALYIGNKINSISKEDYIYYLSELNEIPGKIEEILKNVGPLKTFAEKYCNMKNAFFIGRNIDYAVALEGSLKLKEISYINSEAYAAGELKHGSISLVEEGTVVVALTTIKSLVEKMISNIKEVKSRDATILGISTVGNKDIEKVSDFSFYIPDICDIMKPSLSVIPLQVLSYYMAYDRGCDIDKPRNLAKSVTVE